MPDVAFAHPRPSAPPCAFGVLKSALSRMWLVSTYGASVSSVRCGSSIVQTAIARVDADADVFRASRLDEPLQLTRLHVAGVVFDRHLDAGIHDLRPRRSSGPRPSSRCASRWPPCGRRRCRARRGRWGSARSSRHRPFGQLFLGGALGLVEHRRRRANRSHADFEIQARACRRGPAPCAGCPVARSRLPRNRISLKCTTLTFHFAAKSICSKGVHFCAPRLYMSTPKRTGPAGVCAVVELSAVRGALAPSANVAAPRVFTNVRRSAGMSSSVGTKPHRFRQGNAIREQGKILHTAATLQRSWSPVDFGRRRSTCK